MRKVSNSLWFLIAVLLLFGITGNFLTEAAPLKPDKNTILCDHDFDATNTWDGKKIQELFESQNNFFKNYTDPTTGKLVSWVIAERAKFYGISSRVLLAKMQQESSSIWSYQDLNEPKIFRGQAIGKKVEWVLSYGLPDPPAKPQPQFKGFFNQVDNAARSLSKWFVNPESKNDKDGKPWSIEEPHRVEDGTVTPTNRATIALYIYTPWIESNVKSKGSLYNIWKMMFGDTGECVPTAVPPAAQKIAYINPAGTSLYLVNSDGTEQKELPARSVATFEWLPDGQKILYNRGRGIFGPEGTFLLDINTGEEKKILEQQFFIKLSPDGKQVLYWEGELWKETLTIFDLESQSSKPLPIQQTYRRLELGSSLGVTSLIWSPDSKKIAYIDNNYVESTPIREERGTAVWLINLETLEKEIFWSNTLGAVGNPIYLSWSEDGQKIGLLRTLVRQGVGSLTFDIWKIGSESSELPQTVLEISYEPKWAGGDMLAKFIDVFWTGEKPKIVLSFPEVFWRHISAVYEIQPTLTSPGLWLFEEGKEPKLLYQSSAYFGEQMPGYMGIDISPDGTFVVFDADVLYTIDIDGTNPRKIAELVGLQPMIAP